MIPDSKKPVYFLKRHPRILAGFLVVFIVGGGVFWFAREAQGVNRTWDCGGGDNSWNNDLNWSGDTEPGASDVAIFDTTCTNSVTIDKSISVAGMSINSGYTGTITQSSTYTVTVGSSHFVQAAGTFTGGSGTIDINGTFTLSGGTFTSTSGTLEIGRSVGAAETFFLLSGGTFNHNNGTVSFVDYSGGVCGSPTLTVDIQTSLTLYNIVINSATGGCSAASVISTAASDTIIASNDFTLSDGVLLGTWEVQGGITIGSGADVPWYAVTSPGTLTYTGAGAKTYSYATGGVGPHLRVNTATGSLSANVGTTDLRVNMFSLLAGTFTAPTGTMTIGRPTNNDESSFLISSGTFNHNNGTLNFVPSGNCGYRGFTVDVVSSLTLYNVIVNAAPGCGYASVVGTGSGDTLLVTNDITISAGSLVGTWDVQGNITIGAGANAPAWNITPAFLTYIGSGAKTYSYATGGVGPHLRVNTATGSLSPASGTTNLNIALFSLMNGTFTAPSGTMTIGRNVDVNETFFLVSGGVFNHNNGTLNFAPSRNCNSSTFTIDVVSSLTLYNIVANSPSGCGNNTTVTTAAGDTIIATNNFTHTDGNLAGTWEVQGDYTVGAGADGGTAGITFTGGNTQTYTDQGGNEPDGDVTINKTANSVTLASSADWNAASQDLTITAGTLLQSSNYALAAGAVTVGASGKWVNNGTGAVTLGGAVANAGLIDFRSSNTCGGGDTIALHSSSNGVQRAWSGAGTFVMRDIEVKDQGGSAAITAYSSTNTSGNGANWTFSGAACPAVPTPKAGLPSGYTRLQGGKVNLR